jgi:hypothetical protein
MPFFLSDEEFQSAALQSSAAEFDDYPSEPLPDFGLGVPGDVEEERFDMKMAAQEPEVELELEDDVSVQDDDQNGAATPTSSAKSARGRGRPRGRGRGRGGSVAVASRSGSGRGRPRGSVAARGGSTAPRERTPKRQSSRVEKLRSTNRVPPNPLQNSPSDKPASTRGRGRGRPRGSGRAQPAKSNGKEWEVEKILDSRIDSETYEHYYEVKWKGYSEKESTWEPKVNLTHCPDVLKAFKAKKK